MFVYHEGMPNTLTDRERYLLDQARQLADAESADAIRDVIGTKSAETAIVYAEAFGVARHLLTELATLVYLKAR